MVTPSGKPGFAQLRAFIVDDNDNMRTLLRRLLNALDVRNIFEYSDGEAALKALPLVQPDFVLSDLSMVPMNGVTFAQAIRQSTNEQIRVLPIIMITGHTERRRIEAARDAGINEILAKPVTPASLFHRLEEIIVRPRPFVRNSTYFGPCRRRQRNPYYVGPLRRATDNADETAIHAAAKSAG